MDVPQLLYDWYLRQWHREEQTAKSARETLNYEGSDVVTGPISESEFIRWLIAPSNNPGIKQDWIDGFTSGHESEVTALPSSVQSFLRDCVNCPPTFLDDDAAKLRDAS